jgi:hypothetical protein
MIRLFALIDSAGESPESITAAISASIRATPRASASGNASWSRTSIPRNANLERDLPTECAGADDRER